VVVALVVVLVVLVAWVVAGRIVERFAAAGGRADGTTLAIGLPPVPTPAEPLVSAPPTPRTVDMSALEPKVVLIPPVAVPRPVRRCGNCRAVGHTRPSCPRLTGALPLPHL
jgi:hypothetical protein